MSQSRSATGAHRKGEAASDGDAACWHYAVNGEHFGPYTEGEMVELFISRELNDETFIWRKGYTRWQPATAEPVFARAIAGERPAAASTHTIQPSAAQVTEGSGRLTIEVRRPGATISESAEKRGTLVTDDVDDAFDSLFGRSAGRKGATPETNAKPVARSQRPAAATPTKTSTPRTSSPGGGATSRAAGTASRIATPAPAASTKSAPASKPPGAGRPSRSTSHLKTSDSLAERLRKLREAREAEASGDKGTGTPRPAPKPAAPRAEEPAAADHEAATAPAESGANEQEPVAKQLETAAAPQTPSPSPAGETAGAAANEDNEAPDKTGADADEALYGDDEITEHYQEAARPLYDDDEDTAIYAEDEATPTTVVSDPESHARQQEATLGRSLHDEFETRDSERRRIAMSRNALADYDPTEDGGKSLEAPPYVLPPVGSDDEEEEPLPAVMIQERKNRIRIAVLITLLVFLMLVMIALLLVRGGEEKSTDTAESTEQAAQDDAAADAEAARLEAILRQNEGLARSRALRTVGEALSNSERDSYRQAQELAGRAETDRRPSSGSTRAARSARNNSGGDTASRAAAMGFQLDPSRAPQVNIGARNEEPTGPSASHFASTMGSTVQTSINRCTQRHRALSGSLNFSRVELQVSVAPDGSVEGLSVQRDIRDSAFANCLRSESSRWRFEPFEGSTQRIGRNFIVR